MRLSIQKHKRNIPLRDIVIFAVLGSVMYISYAIMQGLPNIHLIGVLIGALTLVYRARALIPIYVFVMLSGVFGGFSFWWLPYIYIWLPLWGAFMLIGKLSNGNGKKAQAALCMAACALHGLTFGIMYAPAQALFFGLSFNGTLAWIAAGFVFDIIHAVSNAALALLILPLSAVLEKIRKQAG